MTIGLPQKKLYQRNIQAHFGFLKIGCETVCSGILFDFLLKSLKLSSIIIMVRFSQE